MNELPKTLTVCGKSHPIYSDFRAILAIMEAFSDNSLNLYEKQFIALNNLYKEDFTEFEDIDEAAEQARWFIDGGKTYKEAESGVKIFDWVQDSDLILSAVDKNVKTCETCLELPYLHWWTFLQKLGERDEKCKLSVVMGIRDKLKKGKELERWEREMIRENREMIMLSTAEDDAFWSE